MKEILYGIFSIVILNGGDNNGYPAKPLVFIPKYQTLPPKYHVHLPKYQIYVPKYKYQDDGDNNGCPALPLIYILWRPITYPFPIRSLVCILTFVGDIFKHKYISSLFIFIFTNIRNHIDIEQISD